MMILEIDEHDGIKVGDYIGIEETDRTSFYRVVDIEGHCAECEQIFSKETIQKLIERTQKQEQINNK